ncbi:transcriptional regulator, MarR family [Shewanella psychrophila]|uniref:Transcriptional regulator, MarR family n=1 Tax=Shewanella psychrophila TaxID=225848 RepID=A0A1S6HME9_9GAMM|nr:MarR family transcriptional regulator [Shewanella psychrophila]AQS36706.1 transcriptional regulator, MarR family [Shewanella psychrophila]
MSKKFERQASFGWLTNVIANRAARKFEEQLKKQGLTLALWPVLMCLFEEEGVTQSEIARKSMIENSTTTRTLDKLVKLSLVERQSDPNSRRSFHIYLTEKGRALQSQLLPIPVAVNKELLAPLSASEQKELIRLLQKLVN